MDESMTILRQQAWDYFVVVAAQRLTVLNYYIAISSVIAGVQYAVLDRSQLSQTGAFLGVLILFLSFIFWKWDKRSSDMVRIAENALKYFEDTVKIKDEGIEPHVAKIFHREEYFTNIMKGRKSVLFWKNYYTYRKCLNLIYIIFALIGSAGILLNLLRN